jgi:hypothetical protein
MPSKIPKTWFKVGKGSYSIQAQGAKGGRITIPQVVLDLWGIETKDNVLMWRSPEINGILITPDNVDMNHQNKGEQDEENL